MNRTSPRLAARRALALTLAAIAPLTAAQLPPGDGSVSVTVNVTEPSPTRIDEAMV